MLPSDRAELCCQATLTHTSHRRPHRVVLLSFASAQAMVNLVWSCATLIGEECANNPHIHIMFMFVRQEAVLR